MTSEFNTPNVRVRLGATTARSLAAARRSRVAGCVSRENGRISFLITGVVARRNGRVWRSEGPSARAPGRSLFSAGPSWLASASTSVSVELVCFSVPGSSSSERRRLASCEAMAWKFTFEESTNWDSWRSRSPSAVVSSWKLWMTRRTFFCRRDTWLVIFLMSRPVGSKRLNVWRSSAGASPSNASAPLFSSTRR